MLIIFGSINIDLMVKLDKLPQPGETVLCPSYDWQPGGKGANQALAAGRAGAAKVAMVGLVGEDGFGTRATNNLRRDGVMTSGVGQSDLPTGCAVVYVDAKGENQIVVAKGANADVSAEQVPDEILGPANYVLMQMEIESEQNWEVVNRAHESGAKTILNMAPAGMVPNEILKKLDYLIVNEIEANQIASKIGIDATKDAMPIAHALSQGFDLTCIVTTGKQGAVAVEKGQGWRVGIMQLEDDQIVDTTGAGDCFCGYLAASLHEGHDLKDALHRASVAGTLCCTRKGAQDGIPYVGDVEEHLENLEPPEAVKL